MNPEFRFSILKFPLRKFAFPRSGALCTHRIGGRGQFGQFGQTFSPLQCHGRMKFGPDTAPWSGTFAGSSITPRTRFRSRFATGFCNPARKAARHGSIPQGQWVMTRRDML